MQSVSKSRPYLCEYPFPAPVHTLLGSCSISQSGHSTLAETDAEAYA